ncbi:hypothetical protein NUW54_g5787 [Trametes sanguinea]|nr:hypothetical protein NUW54_g5787 [Trametes sanguinea]
MLPLSHAYVSRRSPAISGKRSYRASLDESMQSEPCPAQTQAHSPSHTVPPPATIIVTAPSSPDDSPKVQQSPLPPVLPRIPEVLTQSDLTAQDLHATSATNPQTSARPEIMSNFEQRLAAAALPDPGPDYFLARRAIWCTPAVNDPAPTPANASRLRLESLLDVPGAIEDDDTWRSGLDKVWEGLVAGARLRHRLPLALVIKILQAGWIREGTWPRGAVAPDSDDAGQTAEGLQDQAFVLSTVTTPGEHTPTLTTPGSVGTPIGEGLTGDFGQHSNA